MVGKQRFEHRHMLVVSENQLWSTGKEHMDSPVDGQHHRAQITTCKIRRGETKREKLKYRPCMVTHCSTNPAKT